MIVLDHRVTEQVSSRRLRIVKYRGSLHGTNEYPFLIDEDGFSVLPITSIGLHHIASTKRISTGIARLDAMLDGKGYYRGSTVLVSGTAGTGKGSLAAAFAAETCRRGERVLYFAFEESPNQIIRNMRSIGIDLEPWVEKGLLQIQANRPSFAGLERHLTKMHKLIKTFKPQVVIVDPVSSFIVANNDFEVRSMIMRLVDLLKSNQISSLFTTLTLSHSALEQSAINISSLIDTWLLLRDIEVSGERNRGLYVLKSRGMAHSNQIREYLLTSHGIELRDVYVGPGGMLTGSARLTQEAQERASQLTRQSEIDHHKLGLELKRKTLEAQIVAMRSEFEAEEIETLKLIENYKIQDAQLVQDRKDMGLSRKADAPANRHEGDVK